MLPKDTKINQYKTNIEKVLTNWAFTNGSPERDIKFAEIKEWLKNFQISEIEYAIKVMENIQYYDDNRIRSIIKDLSGKIKAIFQDELKNVLFFPLGESSASSGGMFLYQYRKELGLTENNFLQDNFKQYIDKGIKIVFFDDIIGSGHQACSFFKKYLDNKLANFYYFSLLGLKRGLLYVKEHTRFTKVIVGEIISDEEMPFSENSRVFKEKNEREIIKQICEKYGKELFKKYPLGYDDTQALIVFPYNTPNNTLPIIWASNDNEASTAERLWKPLWNRKKVQEKSIVQIKKTITNPGTFFDIMVDNCKILKERLSTLANIKICDTTDTESISLNINSNENFVFFKTARNPYFETENSVLVWLYKNKCPTMNSSFNGIIEQNTTSITVFNMGFFLTFAELEIKFPSINDFIVKLFNEILSLFNI